MNALPRLLLIDDDEVMRRTISRFLGPIFEVVTAVSAEAGLATLPTRRFEAVLSDVHMSGMSGVDLLQKLHAIDPGLPVLLMSGVPGLDAAIKAVEYGAVRYLVKPFDLNELRGALVKAVETRRQSQPPGEDRAALNASVDGALRTLRVAWQPIVSWSRRRVVAYEALLRSRMPTPDALFEVAAKVDRAQELGRAMRDAVAAAAEVAPPADLHLNLHPQELLDEHLYDPHAKLSRLAQRVVLEITERASLETLPELRERVARLRKLGFRMALDDMGAGYAGLSSFALLEPEVVKLDLSLVRDVHHSATRRRLITSLLSACRDLSCACVAEGVELPAERDTLTELGCDLFQGFLFARPDFAFPSAKF